MSFATALAAEQAKSADEIAKELANPAGSLASLNFNLQYQTFKGDLPDADDQDSWSLIFQPTLPFPVGDQGRRVIFRPAVPVLFDQPVFDADKRTFDDANLALGDITFDLVYAGTEMKTKKDGFLWGIGGAGTLPTATDSDVAGKQWRLGPELFGGIIREWGIVGALVSNQWNIGGWSDQSYSVMTAQYFYAIGLGKGWQIASSPVVTYDWNADSDQALTLPVGIGLAKTTKLGGKAWKFQAQVQYFVEQPDAFGPDWLLKFTVTPVVQNKLAGLFK
ncbi:MAG: hypothetical protein GY701_21485 [Sulfitobacter sp.]|nr:hypothetical protein [Sulfitobacter sp.]